jgi:uncharacterized protein (DUF433 family)
MASTIEDRCHLGVGLYSLADAARLIRTPVKNIRRWASHIDGVIPRILDPAEQTITFVELMELYFIKMFRDEGVSLQTIRRASKAAAAKFDAAYPFSVKRFDTDGRAIFATLRQSTKSEFLIEDLEKGQLVFATIMRPFFRKLEYAPTSEIARFWPLSKRGRVVLDPARKFGKPIDFETGIPTRVITDALSAGAGQSPETVARWLGIPLAAVNAAVAFERSLAV